MPYNYKSLLLCFFSFTLLLFSCQKDVSVDYGPASGGTSTFTYDGAPSSCGTATINGSYNKGIALTAFNTVDITVNVTKIGTYNVTTTSGNGIYFKGSGSFGATGVQTITLTGYGTPLSDGAYIFVPRGNGCNFSVAFTTGGGGGGTSAVFTYAGAPGNCTGATPSGTYYNGVAMSASNYVDLSVNVTTVGAYTITTNSSKGISFTGSGVFTTAGANTVRLIAQGTPNATGAATLTPTGGCSFSVTIAAAPAAGVFTYNCTVAPRVAGTYTAGTALNATNTVTIDVNVTTIGSYSVTTGATNNGVTFSKSGVFTATGAQTIVLTSTDIPTLSGPFNYTPSGAGGCAFSVTYGTGGGGGGGGSSSYYFKFNDGSNVIASDTVDVIGLTVPNGGLIYLTVQAFSVTGDTSFALGVATTGNPQINVNYNTSNIGIPLSQFVIADNNTMAAIYSADVTTFGQNIVIRFDVIDYTNHIVSGTFSGVAKTPTGVATITLGKFRGDLQ